ncbi:RHS repeat-associated core domain-containing protein [Pseudomonas sp. KNUC1026]|uniref:RHS repeat-associated core domain-containing protein n=1 Tax=Pseudomonas sp. KNUC1026 TaxID=2893890 RepID=UPI001F3C264B|nr:RHS repeat-associated core domain-containing protein [Pseudomonas sp. KNUC1026]UFH51558.1 hypothetical protein LN139_11700 [Pseudomonas sp. KNUC1026]
MKNWDFSSLAGKCGQTVVVSLKNGENVRIYAGGAALSYSYSISLRKLTLEVPDSRWPVIVSKAENFQLPVLEASPISEYSVLDAFTKWKPAGDENSLVWHKRQSETSKVATSASDKVRTWEVVDRFTAGRQGDEVEIINKMIFRDNPANKQGIEIETTGQTAGKPDRQVISKEVRSRLGRRCVERAEPGHLERMTRDALGRVTVLQHFTLASGQWREAAKAEPDEQAAIEYDSEGNFSIETRKDGVRLRRARDGLQRVVRVTQPASSIAHERPLDDHHFATPGSTDQPSDWSWDYLPGGEARISGWSTELRTGNVLWSERVSDNQGDREAYFLNPNEEKSSIKVSKLRWIVLSNMDDTFEKTPADVSRSESEDEPGSESEDEPGSESETSYESVVNNEKMMYLLEKSGKLTVGEFQLAAKSAGPAEKQIYDLLIPQLEDAVRLYRIYSEIPPKYVFFDTKFTPVELIAEESRPTSLTEVSGVGDRVLSQRTTLWTPGATGQLEHQETLKAGNSNDPVRITRQFDNDGRLITLARTLGSHTCTYTLERDALGRVTKLTRPDGTTLERTYHQLSNQVTELKVGGTVVASQKITSPSRLASRKVGGRAYSFSDDDVTLPDGNTQLQTQAQGDSVSYASGQRTLASLALARQGHAQTATVTAGPVPGETDAFHRHGWEHQWASASLPGCERVSERTPRRQARECHWRTLRGQLVASLRADGHWRRVFDDVEGRLLRTCQDHEDTHLAYDALGRLQARRVHALKAAQCWQVRSEHDGLGRETLRTWLGNGAPVFQQRMAWRADGRLLSKQSHEQGKLIRTERFAYDDLDRLAEYHCDATEAGQCPADGQGNRVKEQRFTWDSLDNLSQCVATAFDGTQHTRAFAYADAANPTRLTSVVQGKATTALKWNTNGYLDTDDQGRALSYSPAGQLEKVCDKDGKVLARYAYDGRQRLAAQQVQSSGQACELRYDGDELIGEAWFGSDGALSRQASLSPGLAEYEGGQVRWLLDDPQAGITGHVQQGALALEPLLPFGEQGAGAGTGCGHNGMRRDPVTGHYHAGNGYRTYVPALCRYAQPDWLSPFGEGGINDYAFGADPINQHDPSGAIMVSRWGEDHQLAELEKELRESKATPWPVGGRWRGIALSVTLAVLGVGASIVTGGTAAMWVFAGLTALSLASLGLEIAAVFVEDSNPELAKALNIASMATGILSIGNFAGLFKNAWKLLKGAARLAQRIARSARSGLRLVEQVFVTARRYGLRAAQGTWRTGRKAAAPGTAASINATHHIKMGDEWGEAWVDDTVFVEKDWLLRIFSTDKYHALKGWQARLYTNATQYPRLSAAGDVATSLIEMNIYRSTLQAVLPSEDAGDAGASTTGGWRSGSRRAVRHTYRPAAS